MWFFKVKHYFCHISGMVGPIDVKQKGSALVWCRVQYVTLTFDLTHDLDLGCFKVKFRNSSISGIVGLIDVKWEGSDLIWYWGHCMTLPFDHTHQGWGEYWTYEYEYWKISTRVVLEYNVFSIFMFIILGKTSTWVVLAPALTHTHDLDLGVSSSESEIALSQEWGGRLTMNEKDVSHPFMTMILTCVTMVGWADVLDSDRGDFRRRRAVDISSCLCFTNW